MSNEYEFSEVDWDYWSLKPFPQNWEVAGLVCNIPPDELNPVDELRDLEFLPFDWCGKEEEFKKKLSLISENAPYAGYDASEYAGYGRVDMKQFLLWVKVRTKWVLPKKLEEIALGFVNEQVSKPRIQEERDKPKTPREEANDMRLIGALLSIIMNDERYKSEAELIEELIGWYEGSSLIVSSIKATKSNSRENRCASKKWKTQRK